MTFHGEMWVSVSIKVCSIHMIIWTSSCSSWLILPLKWSMLLFPQLPGTHYPSKTSALQRPDFVCVFLCSAPTIVINKSSLSKWILQLLTLPSCLYHIYPLPYHWIQANQSLLKTSEESSLPQSQIQNLMPAEETCHNLSGIICYHSLFPGLELRALHLLGKYSMAWATLLAPKFLWKEKKNLPLRFSDNSRT
jgi:hypothetical protein